MVREIIFQMDDPKYRVVCQFGKHYLINFNWWGYLQKEVEVRRFGFFGPKIKVWQEVDCCWWTKSMDSRFELEQSAKNLYRKRIIVPETLIEKAKNL